jgi:hypothetical protein
LLTVFSRNFESTSRYLPEGHESKDVHTRPGLRLHEDMKKKEFRCYAHAMFMKDMNLRRFILLDGGTPAAPIAMAIKQAFG